MFVYTPIQWPAQLMTRFADCLTKRESPIAMVSLLRHVVPLLWHWLYWRGTRSSSPSTTLHSLHSRSDKLHTDTGHPATISCPQFPSVMLTTYKYLDSTYWPMVSSSCHPQSHQFDLEKSSSGLRRICVVWMLKKECWECCLSGVYKTHSWFSAEKSKVQQGLATSADVDTHSSQLSHGDIVLYNHSFLIIFCNLQHSAYSIVYVT